MWYNIRMIDFYGEISLRNKQIADRLKKKYFAVWTLILTAVVAVIAVVSGVTGGGWIVLAVFALLLALLTVFLFLARPSRSLEDKKWLLRVTIAEDRVTFIQYLPNKEVKKVKRIADIKKVIRTKTCYFLVYNDVSNAFLCQRSLLKRGTFDLFETLFKGKIVDREL